MAKKKVSAPENEATDLLKKLLVLQLFALGVPQASIAKRVRLRLNTVNDLVKGIKKNG